MPHSPENAWPYVQIVIWMHLTEQHISYMFHLCKEQIKAKKSSSTDICQNSGYSQGINEWKMAKRVKEFCFWVRVALPTVLSLGKSINRAAH